MIDIDPADRLLVLGLPSASEIRRLAARLEKGVLVALGGPELVAVRRRELSDLINVMFIPAERTEIPWREGFFTKVLETETEWLDPERVAAEIARVLPAGGYLFLPADFRTEVGAVAPWFVPGAAMPHGFVCYSRR